MGEGRGEGAFVTTFDSRPSTTLCTHSRTLTRPPATLSHRMGEGWGEGCFEACGSQLVAFLKRPICDIRAALHAGWTCRTGIPFLHWFRRVLLSWSQIRSGEPGSLS